METHEKGRYAMLIGKKQSGLFLVVVGVAIALLSDPVYGDEAKDQEDFMKATDRVMAIGTTENLSERERQDRVRQLEAMGQEIEKNWGDRDVEKYGRLMDTLCARIDGMDVQLKSRGYIAQSLAVRALEQADKMPLDVHCDLLRGVRKNVGQDGKALEGNAWAELRKSLATLQLVGWQRIEETIDESWDTDDTGVGNVMPPLGANVDSGVAPEAIADLKLRAEYEAAIKINRQKIDKATLQYRARDLKKYWVPGVERFLIGAYMEAPDRLEELESLLASHVTDRDKRARILNAVKNKKMPEDLVLRNTTQPARQDQ